MQRRPWWLRPPCWLLLALLKMVRSEQREAPHRDSVEDLVAYCGLFGEARLGGC